MLARIPGLQASLTVCGVRGAAPASPAQAWTQLRGCLHGSLATKPHRWEPGQRATSIVPGSQSIPVKFIHLTKLTEHPLCVGHCSSRVPCRHEVPTMTGIQGEGPRVGFNSRPREGGGLPEVAELPHSAFSWPSASICLTVATAQTLQRGQSRFWRLWTQILPQVRLPRPHLHPERSCHTVTREPPEGTAGPALGSGCRTGRDKKIC